MAKAEPIALYKPQWNGQSVGRARNRRTEFGILWNWCRATRKGEVVDDDDKFFKNNN